jgi:hypothetical protein
MTCFQPGRIANPTVQRIGASRSVQRQIQRQGRLAPLADLMRSIEASEPLMMKAIALPAMTLVLLAASTFAGVPFPHVDESVINPEIRRLVEERIVRHNDAGGSEIDRKIVSMGTNAVSTLIVMAQKAANTDPLVLGEPGCQDFSFELRRPLDILVSIGDRRAIPVISVLVKFDTKPRRMSSSIAELLCHGTDEQIKADANSQDPNVARAAQTVLRYPEQYKYYKDMYRKKREIVEQGGSSQ